MFPQMMRLTPLRSPLRHIRLPFITAATAMRHVTQLLSSAFYVHRVLAYPIRRFPECFRLRLLMPYSIYRRIFFTDVSQSSSGLPVHGFSITGATPVYHEPSV